MKVRDRIKIYKDDRSVEVEALFDTGSAKSYLAERVAVKLGYEPYPKPVKVPLAVEDYLAEVVGDLPVYLEIAGYRLPERELLGVIRKLRVEAVIGVNIMEPYEIILEKDRVAFRRTPPRAHLFKL